MTDPGADIPDRFTADFTGATLLSTYRVEKKLADGGMGSIYFARDTNLGRPVVVKVPHPRFLGEPGFRGRFVREVAELVRLEHPHIARILAQGEHEDIPFFVLQYLGGGSLEEMAERGPLAPKAVVPWLATVAETLDYVHGRGIVHRDVKPANILFDEVGHVFLSDFGVAKALEHDEVGFTHPGAAIGSPLHMAPEQGTDDDVGPSADQYALASTIFEVLTGGPPFATAKPLRALVRKSTEDAPDIRERLEDLPEDAAAAIMRALSRDPADRFSSCTEFADAFTDAVRASATTAGLGLPAPETAGPAPSARRGRLLGVAFLALVLCLLGAGALLVRGSGDEPAAPPEPSEPTDPDRIVVLVSPGDAPRNLLRYRVVGGTTERYLSRSVTRADLRFGGVSPETTPTRKVLSLDLHVEAVDERGEARFSWTVVSAELEKEKEGLSSAQAAILERNIGNLRGATLWATADDRGFLGDVLIGSSREVAEPPGMMHHSLEKGLKELCTPLPVEPVGVGALWETTRVVSEIGMRLTRTMTYELLEIDGDEARVRVAAAMTAPTQDYSGLMPAGIKGRLLSLHGSVNGEVRLDLTRLVPLSSRLESSYSVESETDAGGGAQPMSLEYRSTATLEGR